MTPVVVAYLTGMFRGSAAVLDDIEEVLNANPELRTSDLAEGMAIVEVGFRTVGDALSDLRELAEAVNERSNQNVNA